jgi:endonuclease/exonuclease/phosphatase family metal-dependent hydrolase
VAIRLASWNVEGRLSDYAHGRRGSADHILAGIEAIDADVVVLPEAYLGDQPAEGVNERLAEMGYEWRDVRYGDQDRDWSKEFMGCMPTMRVLSRLAIVHSEQMQWGDLRNQLAVTVCDKETGLDVRIIAAHWDDRTVGHRQRQSVDAIPYINTREARTVLAGDGNEMHKRSRIARIIASRLFGALVRLIPSKYPLEEGVYADDLRGVGLRGIEMATGGAIEEIEQNTNLRDIDIHWQPTTTLKMRSLPWMPSIRIAQIDRIFVSPDVTTDGVKVWPDGGSDHRAISTKIEVK